MKKSKNKKSKNNKGFTLIELLATIAILSIIASVGLYVSVDVTKTAKEKSYEVTLNNVEKNAGTYVTENNSKIFYLTRGNIEYQCISIQELIELGYLNNNVVNSQINIEGETISVEDYIYIERDSKSKSLLKSIYDKHNDYECRDAVKAEGDITFMVRPSISTWSHQKEVTINYKIKNRQNTDSYQLVYSLGNNNNSIEVTHNPMTVTIDEDTTIRALILKNNEPLEQSALSIEKIDNTGPTISLTTGHTLNGNHNDSIKIPITIYDNQSKVNIGSIDKNDFTVTIGGTSVSSASLTKLSEVGNSVNYQLEVTNSTQRGDLSVKVLENKIFDNIENGNNEIELVENLHLTMNKVYNVVADAHTGTITTTSGWIGSGASAHKDVIYGEAYGPFPTISKKGYSLDGWFTAASGGTEISSSTIVSTGSNHQLFARWRANKYLVTLISSEGTLSSTSGWTISGSSATKEVTYDSTYGILPTPTRSGFRFDGWFTAASGGTQITSSTKVSITAPQTLYAHWTALTMVVTVNANGGTISSTSGWTGSGASATKTLTYDKAYGLLPTPTRTGYTFDGWFTAASGGTKVESTTIINTNVNHTLYAHWTGNIYRVTFYYQSNATAGSTTLASTTASCQVANTEGTCNITIPSSITGSKGTWNNTYAGLSTSVGNMTQAVASTATTITRNSNATYYALYRSNVTIYRPNSTASCTTQTMYRNQWFTSTTAMATTVLASATTGVVNVTPDMVSGYALNKLTAASASGGTAYTSVASAALTAITTFWTTETKSVAITNTYYYNNNTTAGGTTLASTTASANATQTLHCTSTAAATATNAAANIAIPAAVRSSVGTWNNAYAGLSTSVGNMTQAVASSATAISRTGNGTYYAFYRSNVTVYRPSTTTACTTSTMYRNQWFTSNTALATTVLSDSTTGTSNVNPGLVSGYTFNRLTTASANAGTGYTVANAALTATGTFWTTETKSVAITNTYYYNNNTTAGGTTLASTTASANATQTLHCTSTAAATATNAAANVAVPAAVRSSVGTYNNAYAGLSTSVGNMTQAVASSATAISRTGNGTYYAFYRSNVTVYRPSSTTACTIGTMYRNQWFTSNTALATTVLSDSTTGTSNVNPGLVSGYTFNRLTTASANAGTGYTVANAALTATGTFWTTETKSVAITNTYYYNNNATAGGTTLASTTASANATQTLNCTSTGAAAATNAAVNISVPAAVRSSVGTYNNAYVGLSTSVGNMTQAVASSATAISRTGNGTYYAFYRSNVTVYRPSTTTACTAQTMYRNQWFSSNTALATTVLSTSNTGTSNANPGLVSGYTFNRLTTASANAGTGYTVANAALTATGTFWTTEAKTITATFKYSNNATGTVASTTANGTQTLHCNATTTATLVNGAISRTVPGTAPYGTTAVGWSTGANNMSTTSPTTGVTAYYAVYRSNVAIYRPTSTTVCTAQQFYRNGVMAATGATTYTMHLSTSNTGITDVNPTMISGYSLVGLFENPITGGTKHTIATAAKTTLASFFVSETQNITGTFKYSSSTTGAVSSKTATATQGILCISTTAAQTNSSNYSISVTHAAPYGTTFVGWSTSANSMATTTPNTTNTTFYAVYRGTVTNYYYNSGYTSRTLYRNAFMNAAGATNYSAVLSTTNTGTSNYATAVGPNNAVWAGLAASQTATVAYSSVAAAATTTATNLYTVYQYNITYLKGSYVSSIGATSGYCRFTTGATTCNITLPSITANSGYVAVGWSASSGVIGMIAGCTIPLATNGNSLYGNAYDSSNCVVVGGGNVPDCPMCGNCMQPGLCGTGPNGAVCAQCVAACQACMGSFSGNVTPAVNTCEIGPYTVCVQAGGTAP